MRLTLAHTFHGPSPWADEPAVVLSLQGPLPEGVALQSRTDSLMRHGLKAALKGLRSVDTASVLCAVAHWLLNEVRGDIQTARCITHDDGFWLVLGHHHPPVSVLAVRTAAQLLMSSEQMTTNQVRESLDRVWHGCRRFHPDFQAQILMTAARAIGVPFLPFVPHSKIWQYGWGRRSRVFFESASNADGYVATLLARDKALTKRAFDSLGIPTPGSMVIASDADRNKALQAIGYPCCIKPLDRGGGKGVTANIRTDEHLQAAIRNARQYTRGPLLLERFVQGEDHRLITVSGRLVAVIRREASRLVGDGSKTISELIGVINEQRPSSLRRSSYLRKIVLDEASVVHLKALDLAPDSVLEAGRVVSVRSNSNLSTGGLCTDVTEQVHPVIRAMVETLSQTLGFGLAGFDYLTTDISQPPEASGGAFIEMNTTPGIDATVAAGWTAERIGAEVLGKSVGRVPVYLQIVDDDHNLQDIVAQEMPSANTQNLTLVAGSQVHQPRMALDIKSSEPWAAVRAALRCRETEAVKIICSRTELMANGLPVDRLDRYTLPQTPLPQDWHALLQRCLVQQR